MAEGFREIETDIDRSRERLGSNLRELERRVDAAIDWREHFCARPFVFVGAAFVGGALLGVVGKQDSRPRVRGAVGEARARSLAPGSIDAQRQAAELWNSVQGALLGVASTRIKTYLGDLIPGFEEQLREVDRQARNATSRGI
jgi:hypothetical protein